MRALLGLLLLAPAAAVAAAPAYRLSRPQGTAAR